MTRTKKRKNRIKARRIATVAAFTLIFASTNIGLATGQEERNYEYQFIFENEANISMNEHFSDAIPLDRDIQCCLNAWCEQYQVPYPLALAVIETESSFSPDARNGNCYGYMQVNLINCSWLEAEIGVTDLTNPYQNLQSGVFMLGNLHEKYGDWSKALVAYNCGERGAYNRYFSRGVASSKYSRSVIEKQAEWETVLGESGGEQYDAAQKYNQFC